MITTLTPNPSFDRTVAVERLEPGSVHRATDTTVEAGGKGINVARALATAGHRSRAIFPATTADAKHMTYLLHADVESQRDLLDIVAVPAHRPIRVNVSCVESDGRTTKINEAGGPYDGQSLLAAVPAVTDSAWLVLAGSLPPGMDNGFVTEVVHHAAAVGVPVAVDSSGGGLEAAVSANCALIKPNRSELAALVGARLDRVGDVVDAARAVVGRGVTTVLVSLGADGGLAVTDDATYFGHAPVDEVRNTVGAGDAFLAGFLSGSSGGSTEDGLAEALAWGRAAVQSPTTSFPPADAADRRSVVLTDQIDIDRELTDDG